MPKETAPPSLLSTPKSGQEDSTEHNSKRIARAMRQMMRYLDTHSRKLFKSQHITVPQVMCLDELRERGALPVAALAKAIHLSPSTTVGIIDRLEKKMLVKRTRSDADRRSVFVEITELGRDFVVETPHLLHNRLQGAMKHLSEYEQTLIADSLTRLAQILKNNS